MVNKKLVIFKTSSVKTFPDRVVNHFLRLGGERAEVVNCVDLEVREPPVHDIIHNRFAVARESTIYRRMREHVREHGCICINAPETMTQTSDKYAASQKVKTIMTIPKTVVTWRGDSRFRSKIESAIYPAVFKPQYSSAGQGIRFFQTASELSRGVEMEYGNFIIQEAIDFDKLYRIVFMDGHMIDAIYDRPDEKYTVKEKVSHKSRIFGERAGESKTQLEELCAKIADAFGLKVMYLDLFERDGELIFNEINSAVNLNWITKRTGVPHAVRLASYLRKVES